jgi:hypothetical protein
MSAAYIKEVIKETFYLPCLEIGKSEHVAKADDGESESDSSIESGTTSC